LFFLVRRFTESESEYAARVAYNKRD